MSRNLYTNMEWLPPAPADFAAQCKALLQTSDTLGKRVQHLAGHMLDENNLTRLAKVIRKARDGGQSLAPLMPFRLGIVSNATSHFLLPALEATAARHGIALECIEADFDQVMQEALSPESMINRAQPDAVLVAVDYRGLPLTACPGDEQGAQHAVASALAHLDAVRNGLRGNGKALCIMQTLARPVESLFGGYDAVAPGTLRSLVEAVNRGLAESIVGSEDLLLDVAHLAETVGLAEWHDHTLWNMAKLPFASAFLPLYADHVCRLIAALRGKSRRCLILDLDNTVWGGVIGDDGLEGIVIGQGDATGEAHLAVQQAALSLRGRGVVLAVSSKNTDEIARGPFRKHPEMLLREEHIAVFQANWNDKATNITAIAKELSLGLDAMVFLDDNPVERQLVREMLPQVAVPELPADPALYARTLLAAGYFESIAFSTEDAQRAGFYQDNARRVALQAQAGDMEAYLASLDMVMTVQPFDETGRTRITQLINKSNQYNLTTHRYTEAEVADVETDPDCFGLQIRLADTFGDNGMISVVICRRELDSWNIDTWLMSCRVLGRKVEEAVLGVLCDEAHRRGISQLIGTYLPTERNALVEDHYARLGFLPVDAREDGSTVWQLPIDNAIRKPLPIKLRSIALEAAAEGVAHAA
ncbi:MAG: haloacid dehalogenase [Rhodocyclales bacterium]|nr:haloacid dehalogenase [Rhodocyclales bacterium]